GGEHAVACPRGDERAAPALPVRRPAGRADPGTAGQGPRAPDGRGPGQASARRIRVGVVVAGLSRGGNDVSAYSSPASFSSASFSPVSFSSASLSDSFSSDSFSSRSFSFFSFSDSRSSDLSSPRSLSFGSFSSGSFSPEPSSPESSSPER